MFNTLASYLLGTSNQQPTGGVEERNLRLTSVVADDDWVLVDQDSEGNSEVESNLSESLDGYDNLDNHNQLPHILTRSSSTASLRCNIMEDSWFVTPPPCFTSAGPVHMETSPLENLLIEHPSMSVYQHSHPALLGQRFNSIPVRSTSESDYSADEVEDVEEVIEQLPVQRLEVEVETYAERQLPLPRRNNRVNILQQQDKQWKQTKRAQKVQLHKACQSLKRTGINGVANVHRVLTALMSITIASAEHNFDLKLSTWDLKATTIITI
ncbi:hypothetical protein FQR65_LT04678 [Abscondita terminalis]|nr:hypothetical protein FQR65_LT04678 [Abscondita terminalis]